MPIPGTKHVKYLSENADAAKIELDTSEVELLNHTKQNFEVKGIRYSEEGSEFAVRLAELM